MRSLQSSKSNQGICDQEQAKSVAKRLFDLYDKNQDGCIEANEVTPMLIDAYKAMNRPYYPNPTDSEAYLQVLDSDRDGKLTYQDVEAFAIRILCGGQQQQYQAPQQVLVKKYSSNIEERLEVARRIFFKFADSNGYIGAKNQISNLLRETYNNQYTPTDDDIKTWLELTDEDGDGRVGVEEFEKAVIRGLQEAGIKLY